jgi:hypothetical protein
MGRLEGVLLIDVSFGVEVLKTRALRVVHDIHGQLSFKFIDFACVPTLQDLLTRQSNNTRRHL